MNRRQAKKKAKKQFENTKYCMKLFSEGLNEGLLKSNQALADALQHMAKTIIVEAIQHNF